MLMKRCDVTIQSFLWAEKALGKEGEIVAAIQSQRLHLVDEPPAYSVLYFQNENENNENYGINSCYFNFLSCFLVFYL